MSAAKIKADYEQLAQIADLFEKNSSLIAQQVLQRMMNGVEQLQSGDWVGTGADIFYSEINEVMPAISSLSAAMAQAATSVTQISQRFKQAEEDAAWVLLMTGDAPSGAASTASGNISIANANGDGIRVSGSASAGVSSASSVVGATANSSNGGLPFDIARSLGTLGGLSQSEILGDASIVNNFFANFPEPLNTIFSEGSNIFSTLGGLGALGDAMRLRDFGFAKALDLAKSDAGLSGVLRASNTLSRLNNGLTAFSIVTNTAQVFQDAFDGNGVSIDSVQPIANVAATAIGQWGGPLGKAFYGGYAIGQLGRDFIKSTTGVDISSKLADAMVAIDEFNPIDKTVAAVKDVGGFIGDRAGDVGGFVSDVFNGTGNVLSDIFE